MSHRNSTDEDAGTLKSVHCPYGQSCAAPMQPMKGQYKYSSTFYSATL